MKHLMKLGTLLAIASTLAATALAQTTFSFDENGNGFFSGVAVPGVLSPVDPSGGVAGPVLIYTLPAVVPPVTIGDAILLENAANTNISDVIRFWDQNRVIFYSDPEAGSGDADLADISGLPAQLLSNRVLIAETGVEGNNGANYTPLPGQPGGSTVAMNYQIISDVPEPGSVLLSTLGGGLFLLLRHRRQARRI